MIDRRQFVFAGACLLAAGSAEALRPRKRLRLLGAAKLDAIVPRAFGSWREVELGMVVQPAEEGSLAARLYSETLTRVYQDVRTSDFAMLALAYGASQSDLLQLHRPESCYPAFGFALSSFEPTTIDLAPGASLPARSMMARAPGRTEIVTYWTRVGEFLPTSQSEQRFAKLRTGLDGFVADGMLVRCSTLGDWSLAKVASNSRFLGELVMAIAPPHRAAFVGTAMARRLAQAAPP